MYTCEHNLDNQPENLHTFAHVTDRLFTCTFPHDGHKYTLHMHIPSHAHFPMMVTDTLFTCTFPHDGHRYIRIRSLHISHVNWTPALFTDTPRSTLLRRTGSQQISHVKTGSQYCHPLLTDSHGRTGSQHCSQIQPKM